MKILIIDDIEDSVKGIIDSCEEHNWEYKLSDFNASYEHILVFNPDIIILDWMADADRIDIGNTILNRIWSVCFRPVVIFSANAAVINIDEKLQKSSLVKIIPKGDEQPVIDFLEQTERFVSALSSYRKDMGQALISSLNSVEFLKNETIIEDNAIGYVLSKRTSAFFDKEFTGELSPSWVQYLCPPVNSQLCVCDVIRKKSLETSFENLGNPEEYLLILTPSCDMVSEPGRDPKVTHALCARCFPKELFHGCSVSSNPSKGNVKSTISKLNLGYCNSYVAIPGFSKIIPYMTVDLKKLELVALNKIALSLQQVGENDEYVRVASIASPFREQIVWAHMQNACRPGVPDRNTELWAKEILTQ